MTQDIKDVLKLALEALEEAWYHVGTFQPTEKAIDLYDEARTAIKEALREHAMYKVQRLGQEIEQEPVADAYTFAEMRFVVCHNCGNKRCPKANDHRNACTNSNEVGQKGSSWEHVKPLAQPEQEPVTTLEDLEQEIYENTRQFVSHDVMEWMLKRYYTTPPQRKELEQWGASSITNPEYVAEQKRKTEELRAMVAQPEQEPVAYLVLFEGAGKLLEFKKGNYIHGAKVEHIPLYAKPQIEVGCAECGVNGGHALYCVACAEKFVGGYKDSGVPAVQTGLEQVSPDTPPQRTEPVAWLEPEWGEKICPEVGFEATTTSDHPRDLCWIPLYPHPPQRTWVGLTDAEAQLIYDMGRTPSGMMEMVEAKLKEKNT